MTKEPAFDMKICGLSSTAAVSASVASGATMVGLVFFKKSPRNVELEVAASLAACARSNHTSQVDIVALTVNPTDDDLERVCNDVAPDVIQLHGSESPERVLEIQRRVKTQVMKAIGVSQSDDFAKLKAYACVADRLLIDAKPPKDSQLPGGNGLTFDWNILDALTADIAGGLPVMLSGGLTTGNVAEAVRLSVAHPVISGIDVSSGVETSPGVKDKDLIEKFLRLAKAAHSSQKSQKGFAA
ncbi:MAG: phosphoribosylanthranilate isomerase [Hyphomicrobiales bacterium]